MEKEELKNLTDEQIQEEMDKLRKQIIEEDLDIDVIGNIEEQIDELEAELNRRIETREKMKEEASETKEGNEEMEAEQDEEKETEQDEETKEDKNSEESSKEEKKTEEKPTPEPEANSNKEDEPKKLTEEQIKEEIEKLENRNKDLLDRRKKLKEERDKLPNSESRTEEERKQYFKLEKKSQEIFGKIELNNVRLEELREGEPATPDKTQLRDLKKERASLLLIYNKSKKDKKKIDELTAQIDSLKEKIKEEASKTKGENKNPKTNSKEGKKPEKEQRQNGNIFSFEELKRVAKKYKLTNGKDIEIQKWKKGDSSIKNPKDLSKEERTKIISLLYLYDVTLRGMAANPSLSREETFEKTQKEFLPIALDPNPKNAIGMAASSPEKILLFDLANPKGEWNYAAETYLQYVLAQNGKVAKNIQRNWGAKKMNAQLSYDIEDLKKQVESDKDKKENKNPKMNSEEEKKSETEKPATKPEAGSKEEKKSEGGKKIEKPETNPNKEKKKVNLEENQLTVEEVKQKLKATIKQNAKLDESIAKLEDEVKRLKKETQQLMPDSKLRSIKEKEILQKEKELNTRKALRQQNNETIKQNKEILKEAIKESIQNEMNRYKFRSEIGKEKPTVELYKKNAIPNLEREIAKLEKEVLAISEQIKNGDASKIDRMKAIAALIKSDKLRITNMENQIKEFDNYKVLEDNVEQYADLEKRLQQIDNMKIEQLIEQKLPDSEQTQGQDPEQTQGQDSEQTQGQDPEQTQGQDPEQTQGQDPEQTQGQDPDQTQGQDPDQTPGQDPDQTLPVKAKKGPFKMVKGLLGAIGRKIAKVFQAIKNSPIGKPFSWLFSRIGNKGDLPEMPWSDKFLKFLQLDLENFVDEEQEFTEQKQHEEEKPTKRKPLGKGQDPEKTHAFASSLFEAMRSAKSQENDDHEEADKTPEVEETDVNKADETPEVEEAKPKVKQGLETETVTYGGYEFTGISKSIMKKVQEGKILKHSQLVTAKDGTEMWINPNGTLTDQPQVRYVGAAEPVIIDATVDENGRAVENEEMEL